MRADVFLKERGYAKSRTAAAELISRGVYVNGKKISKPSQEISGAEHEITISEPQKYVSRGGLKLEAALDAFGISPEGLRAVDIGASTGGFTDCLISRGAREVVAVDVGHDQLDSSLATDPRVKNMEGVNARTLTQGDVGGRVPLVVTDVSFISQSLIYGAVAEILDDGGTFISLIKPQFEAGRENIGKSGIVVKDEKTHVKVIEKLITEALCHSLGMLSVIPSPIKGGDGNTEYLALFKKGAAVGSLDIRSCVSAALGGKS
ncbi:MAG: TlyA family RNA methyltransferase [Clostridia bacterium]|nr:TlyA family RNA methyltransferase [Clostridia bacterium]